MPAVTAVNGCQGDAACCMHGLRRLRQLEPARTRQSFRWGNLLLSRLRGSICEIHSIIILVLLHNEDAAVVLTARYFIVSSGVLAFKRQCDLQRQQTMLLLL